MRTHVPVSLVAGLLFVAVVCAPPAHARGGCTIDTPNLSDKSIDFDDDVLVIESEDEDWKVEITGEYELLIDGSSIETDRDQRGILRRYYRQAEGIEDLAHEIASDGAEIGIEGVKVGVLAVTGVVKLLLEDYDSDDLDRDIKRDARDIERKAKRIERKADRLEAMVEDLDALHRKLRLSIPELDGLRGF